MFDRLDFLYMPSRDVSLDLNYLSEVLGGRVVFAIEAMNTRVAAVELTAGPPLVLLADHVEGDVPFLVYRVEDLEVSRTELLERGCEIEAELEIPHGPCLTIAAPGGHRFALYQLVRPEVAAHFEGRRDF